jgi:hypothetical protein
MDITIENPPDERRLRLPKRFGPHGRYDKLFAALTDGKWVAVLDTDVTGVDIQHKQTNLHSLAKIRGMQVQTSFQAGRLYVRRIDHLAIVEPRADFAAQPEADGHGDC